MLKTFDFRKQSTKPLSLKSENHSYGLKAVALVLFWALYFGQDSELQVLESLETLKPGF